MPALRFPPSSKHVTPSPPASSRSDTPPIGRKGLEDYVTTSTQTHLCAGVVRRALWGWATPQVPARCLRIRRRRVRAAKALASHTGICSDLRRQSSVKAARDVVPAHCLDDVASGDGGEAGGGWDEGPHADGSDRRSCACGAVYSGDHVGEGAWCPRRGFADHLHG